MRLQEGNKSKGFQFSLTYSNIIKMNQSNKQRLRLLQDRVLMDMTELTPEEQEELNTLLNLQK